MQRLIRRILEYGTDQTDNYKRQRNIRFANLAIWIGIVSVSFYIVKNVLIRRYDAVFIESVILCLFFFTYRLNKRHYLAAVVISISMMEFFFLACALFLFPGNRIELFFLFMVIIPQIFFFNTFWTVALFVVNILFYFVPQFVLPSYNDTVTTHFVHIGVFSAVFFIVRFFRLQMEAYEAILTRQNERLLQDKALIESQALELKQTDIEKTHFFVNVSHEFRTPLTLISGMADKISEENNNNLSSRGKGQLDKIKYNAEKMSVMIDEILRLAKAGKADYKLLLTPVRMKNFIGKHVDIFTIQGEKNKIIFQTKVIPEDLTLLVDENKFDQIMTNLLSNAIKFSPDGGCVSLEVYEESESKVIIQVSDEGIGLKEDEIESVFGRFTSTAELYHKKGSGIGLTLTRELVELHGGNILARQNKNGKGSSFIIELSYDKKIHAINKSEQLWDNKLSLAVSPIKSGRGKLLLAEDNAEMRDYLSEILAEQGYMVVIAKGGNEALSLVSKQSFDLILTDYMMPDLDGYELAKELKTNPELKNIPIIFLTAKNEEEEKLKVLQLGVDDYMLKPFNRAELLVRIENSIRNGRKRNSFLLSERLEIKEPEDRELVRSFQKIAEEHIADTKLTMPAIAEELSITERNLYRKIKSITGMTPNEFVNEIKLQYARRILENRTYASFKEVAFAVGFETSFYFCKLYEKRFGKHPSEY